MKVVGIVTYLFARTIELRPKYGNFVAICIIKMDWPRTAMCVNIAALMRPTTGLARSHDDALLSLSLFCT